MSTNRYTPYDDPTSNFADSDSFTYQVSDGKGGTDTATVSITVTPDATNEAPVNSVPGSQTTGQDIPLVFSEGNGNRILVRDDAGGNAIQVTLTATNGVVDLAGTTGLSIFGGADGTDTVTVQGTLSAINNALDGLTFTPIDSYLGAASLRVDTNDLGQSPVAAFQTDSDTINIDVIAVNDPPVNTVPGSQTVDQDGMLLFSSTTGTAITISDTDAGGAAVEVTLTATNGVLNLPTTQGLTFTPPADGTDDATMTFTGTVADINAALEGMTFVATAGYTGSAGVQIVTDDQGNTGAGGALSDTDSVDITVRAVETSLWLSTVDNVASPGANGLTSWTAGQAIKFAANGGSLAFEPGTTTGTFSLAAFDLDDPALSDADTQLDGIHYVTRDLTAGGIPLQAGDVLFSTQANETLDGVAYEAGDIILFRPDTPVDYSAGTFSLFFDTTDAAIDVSGFTLVEQSVTVGDTSLNTGDLLLVDGGRDILRYVPAQLGETTSGAQSILIDGDGGLGFGKNITAIDLVEATGVIGNKTLAAGTLLVAVEGEDADVGSGTPIAVTRWDLFTLSVSTTGNGTTSATAELFLEGGDVQLDDNKEAVAGVSLFPNLAPTVNGQTFNLAENSTNGTVVGTVSGTDSEGDMPHYAITAGNTDGTFAIDATTGQITVANSATLDFETTPTFNLTVAAIDAEGRYGTATITVDLVNLDEPGVNDAPENTVPGAQTIDKDGMLLFSSATGTAISISDFDAGSNPVQVTLTATNGTLNLSSTRGLTFTPPADGTADATMTFTGNIADINAALEGATFVATPGFTGSAGVQIVTDDQGNTGTGGALSDTDSVTVTVKAPDQKLWLTFENNQAGTGNSDIPNITAGDVVTFGDITQLETSNSNPLASTTSGTLAYSFNLDTVKLSDGVTPASDGNTIVNAVHYVIRDIQVGSNNIQLQAGDILLSTDADETIDGVTINNDDVFVFRPDTAGDYSQGSFFLLIDGNAASLNLNNITGISLVEQTTVVGGVTVNAGEFLFAHDGSGKNILRYVPGTLGATTTGSASVFIAGADIDIGQSIGGVHLVQVDTGIGGVSLTAGQVLVSLQGDDSAVGDAPTIDAPRQDIFVLDITATGEGTTAGTATRFFEGLDENLDNNNESIGGIGYQGNAAPTVASDTFALDENSANGTVVGSVTASDPENGSLKYAITAGNSDGAFAIDADTGQITVANTTTLDFETTPSFTLTVAAIDAEGAYDTATITVNLNDIDEVNDAPSFTAPGDGSVVTPVGGVGSYDYGYSVTVQPDGKTLVAGYSWGDSSYDFSVARYNTDGSLDMTFGSGNGIATIEVGTDSDLGFDVILQPDGKILFAGASSNGVDKDFALIRLNSDGTLDSSFGGGDGIVTKDIASDDDLGKAVALQTDGKIVVGGFARVGGDNNFALIRYNSDGSIDTTFDSDGIVTTAVPVYQSHIADIAIQADGKIVAIGDAQDGSGRDFAVVRYNTDGSLDTTFGGDGIVITPIGTGSSEQQCIAVQADGKILAGGYAYNGTNYDFAVARYNTDGNLDTSFGDGDGIAMIAIGAGDDRAHDMAILADGKIVLSGSSENGTDDDFAVARLNTDGSLDTSFGGGDGYITAGVAGTDDIANGMAIAPDGSILLAGHIFNGSDLDFTVQRYTADGNLDTSFDLVNTLDGTPTFVEGGVVVILDTDVQIFDQELSGLDNFDGASLTLIRNGGANAEDLFSATGSLELLTESSSLTVDGTTIGTVTTNSGGTLVLTFNANATNALVNSAMQQIAYSNNSDAPPAGVQIDWTFDDGNTGDQGTGGAKQGNGSVTVSITSVNDAPTGSVTIGGTPTEDQTLTASNTLADVDGMGAVSYQWQRNGVDIDGANNGTYTLGDADVGTMITVVASYTDGGGTNESVTSAGVGPVVNVNDAPVISVDATPILYLSGTMDIDPNLAVTDVDDTMLESAQVWFGDGYLRGHDRLRFVDQLGITGSFHIQSGVLTLTGIASVADYQTALRSVQYEDANPTPAEGILYVNFSVSDGTDTSVVDTRVIEIVDNMPPRAGDDFATVAEGNSVVVDLAATDTDADDSLDLTSIVITSAPANGNVVINGDGTVTYTHNGSETSTDSFSYTIKDTDGNVSNEAPVTITVTQVNDSPTVAINTGTTVDEGSTGNVITTAMLNEGDPDDSGTGLIYTLTGDVGNGTLRLNGTALSVSDNFTQIDIDGGLVTYDHDDSETTTDSFDFSLADGGEDGSTAATGTFDLTVTPVNDSTPVADTESFTVAEGGTATQADLDAGSSLLDGDTDIDLPNDTLTVTTTPVVGPSHGSLTLNADGTFSYTHDGTENFTDSFTYEVSDAVGNTDTATVTITITAIDDDAPTAVNQSITVAEGATNVVLTTSELSSTDTDTDDTTLIYTVGNVTNGSLTINGNAWASGTNDTFTQQDIIDGQILYSHDGSNTTSDSFSYSVEDPTGNTLAGQTFSITVTAVDDDAPTVSNQSITVAEGAANVVLTTSELSSTDADTDDATLIYTVGNVSNGSLTINGSAWASGTNDTFTQQDIIDGQYPLYP